MVTAVESGMVRGDAMEAEDEMRVLVYDAACLTALGEEVGGPGVMVFGRVCCFLWFNFSLGVR